MDGTVVVVGGGQAACQFVASLRQLGYPGPLVLISEEAELPYQRPPLSKGYLAGEATTESLQLRPASFYADAACELRLGCRVARIDRGAARVVLEDGEQLAYSRLVLATGARARLLDGVPPDHARICYLRDLQHAARLRQALAEARRVAILGAGYVGMEVAASARKLGREVTVFEAAPRIMQRSVGEDMSRAMQALHRRAGVDVRLGVQVHGVQADGDSVRFLADGEQVQADLLVVGIGAVAELSLAAQAGLACNRGILVDAQARSSDPAIHAIGDCTEQQHPLYGSGIRFESVPNAIEQARIAAADVAGKPLPAVAVPWFWSDQYGHRLQVAGLPAGALHTVLRGTPSETGAPFSVWHLLGDTVLAVEALDAPGDFMAGRNLIRSRSRVDALALADTGRPIAALQPSRVAPTA